MRSAGALILGALLMWAAGAGCKDALADGGFFPPHNGTANSADQQAVVIDNGDRETLVLRTAYQGDGGDFAWVVPVPTLVSGADLGTADESVFDELYLLTEPRAWVTSGGVAGCGGCGGGSEGPPTAGDGERAGVNVWETLEIEGYEIAVLSAQQSGDLAAWLHDNGYAFPQGQQATLDYYVSKAWYFVAFKIAPEQPATPDAATDSAAAQAALDPVVISFDLEGGPLVYPMRISQASSEAESEVLLYVLGPHRVRSSSYPTAEVEASSYRAGQSFPAWYDERFRQAIGHAGGTALIVEYAGAVPVWLIEGSLRGLLDGSEYFVTRLRTYLTPEQMTRDVTLVRAPSDDPFEVSITVPTLASSRMGIGAAMLLVGAVQAGRTRLRRWRNCARLLAVLGLVVLIV